MKVYRKFRRRGLTLLVVLLAAPLAAAPPADKGRGKGPKHDTTNGRVSGQVAVDTNGNVSGMITAGISFGDARTLATRHGLTGARPLPPGIRKNLARGKPLPPGIAKSRMSGPFVTDLPRRAGYEWRQAGADLVLVASGTLVVQDILEGVFD